MVRIVSWIVGVEFGKEKEDWCMPRRTTVKGVVSPGQSDSTSLDRTGASWQFLVYQFKLVVDPFLRKIEVVLS